MPLGLAGGTGKTGFLHEEGGNITGSTTRLKKFVTRHKVV